MLLSQLRRELIEKIAGSSAMQIGAAAFEGVRQVMGAPWTIALAATATKNPGGLPLDKPIPVILLFGEQALEVRSNNTLGRYMLSIAYDQLSDQLICQEKP